jgi:hypothetical protein
VRGRGQVVRRRGQVVRRRGQVLAAARAGAAGAAAAASAAASAAAAASAGGAGRGRTIAIAHRHHEHTVHPAAGGSRRRRLASRKGTAVGCERAWREGARSSLEHPHLSLRKQEHPHLNGRSMLPTLGSHAPAAGGWDAPATEGWDAPGGSYGLGLEDRYLTTPPPRPCLSDPGKTTGTGNGPRGLS